MAKRRYNAERRQEAAQQTRHRVIEAAGELFIERGYVATTMAAIAERAEVALDTVYAAAGTKPQLLRLLVEATIAAVNRPDAGEDVAAIAAEPDVAGKLAIYAAAIRRIQQHLAPLYRVLRSATPLHPELGDLWTAFSQRRAATMPLLVEHLIRAGGLGAARDPQATADTLWMLTSAEVYDLLVGQRGWSPERYEDWLGDSARRFVLGA
ncbi:MAG TPA: helix-turn-helix domain-containing protein [Hyphomicrobiales bacterium]|nr:helix-turn-helix domain-containing protein [Hyphomicrobiales bacterium]